ncbi:putative ribonuclease H-like domain-containing protein [Tanacetum coccineum]
MNVSPIPTTRIDKDHPKEQIIRDLNLAIQTRRMTKISDEHAMNPKKVIQALADPSWVEVMQEELLIEAIRLFLVYASYMGFIVYQMDVKSAFLYGTIEEEVYVCQPPSFEDPHFPDKVYKVEKALYGLHQAPRAWYETLSTYLIKNGFRRGTIDKTLFIKKDKDDILLVQVYVKDIIFRSTKKSLCVEFEGLMHKRFQMSFIGELTFFLGLQVHQKEDGIFISQDIYVAEILKKFDFATVKTTSTPIETNKALVKDEEAEAVDVHLYKSMIGSLMYLTASRPDIMFVVCACARFQVTPKTSHIHAVDYARASLDRKSTTAGCQFLGRRLISWQCKKQTIVANSTTEAEYVVAANYCGQVLWIQNQMLDYGFNFMNTKIYIDNESIICIVKNLVFHSKTKHIEIRHHFIRDSYEKKLIQVIKIHTDHNVVDLLTEAFDVSSGPIHLVIDETVYKEWEDIMERPATTASSLEAEQDSVNTLGSGEDSMKLNELMELCTKLLDIKKQSRRKQRKDIEVSQSSASTEPMTEKETNEESVPTHSYDPSQSGEDRMQLHELMNLCTKLSDRVLALETTKTTQALEIASLKSRVKKLEKKASKRTHKFKRLYRERCIEDIDKDAEVSLVDETQGRSDDTEMFDTDALIGIKILVSTAAPSTIAVSPPVIIEVEITLGQTLAELKSAKSKVVIQDQVQSTVTTVPSTILKAKGVTFRYAGETITRTPTSVSSSSIKDKGKAKMVEPEVPLNKKDQIRLDEELARRLDAEEQEAARLERENVELQEQATLAKIKEWDNVQAMMDADYELCKRLQEQEQGELTIEEKSKLFMELMNERKRHFAKLRAEEKRRKPLTKDSKEVKSSEKKAEGNRKKLIDLLATKLDLQMIDEYKIVKEGQKDSITCLRADREFKNGISQGQRMEKNLERVSWVILKVMFETDIKSEVWRSLQGYKVTVWKLFDSCRVHFVRFKDLHIFMLVEKRYPLTPITITNMLNKKLQADHWNEMCYQLLNLMTK